MKKYVYFLRFTELDEISKFRFINSFLVAIYLTLITPIIIKLQGLYFTTQLITIILISKNLLNKLLEKSMEIISLKLFTNLVLTLKFIEIGILTIYFYNQMCFTYIYVIFELILNFFTAGYGISLTNFVVEKELTPIKTLQIFRSNIWSEGFIIGFLISLLTQTISLKITIITGIILQSINIIIMLKNYKTFLNFMTKFY